LLAAASSALGLINAASQTRLIQVVCRPPTRALHPLSSKLKGLTCGLIRSTAPSVQPWHPTLTHAGRPFKWLKYRRQQPRKWLTSASAPTHEALLGVPNTVGFARPAQMTIIEFDALNSTATEIDTASTQASPLPYFVGELKVDKPALYSHPGLPTEAT
jgi:hypothetical protein